MPRATRLRAACCMLWAMLAYIFEAFGVYVISQGLHPGRKASGIPPERLVGRTRASKLFHPAVVDVNVVVARGKEAFRCHGVCLLLEQPNIPSLENHRRKLVSAHYCHAIYTMDVRGVRKQRMPNSQESTTLNRRRMSNLNYRCGSLTFQRCSCLVLLCNPPCSGTAPRPAEYDGVARRAHVSRSRGH